MNATGHCQAVKKLGIWCLAPRAGFILEHRRFSSAVSDDIVSKSKSIRTTLIFSNLFVTPRESCGPEQPNPSSCVLSIFFVIHDSWSLHEAWARAWSSAIPDVENVSYCSSCVFMPLAQTCKWGRKCPYYQSFFLIGTWDITRQQCTGNSVITLFPSICQFTKSSGY